MRLLRRKEVSTKTGLPRSSLYNAMKRGDFPRPLKIGPRAVAWRSTDVDEWLESRPIVMNETEPFLDARK